MWERGFGGGGGVGGKGIEWVRGIRSVCLYGSLSFSLIYVFEREMKSERARARVRARGREKGRHRHRERGRDWNACLFGRTTASLFFVKIVVLHGRLGNNDTHRPGAFIRLHSPLGCLGSYPSVSPFRGTSLTRDCPL